MNASTIGFDIAKGVIQLHGVDAAGTVVLRRRLWRGQVIAIFTRLERCLVGMEACASAHHWARGLTALGHDVRLISPAYVKPYVKRSKTDAADAAAIREAVSRPHLRFVPVKSRDEQALALAYKARALLVARRTALVNALRAHLAEFGVVASKGSMGSAGLIDLVRQGDERLPTLARESLAELADLIAATETKIAAFDAKLAAITARNEASRRLMAIPGIGPVAAGTILALTGDMKRFRSGRDFAAWLGLTPLQNSSGDRVRIGHMSKAGNRGIRTLLILGAMAVMQHARRAPAKASAWLTALIRRRPPLVVAVALAAKTARVIWAMLARDEVCRPRAA